MLQGVHMATNGGGRKDLRHDRVVSPAGAPGSLEAQRVGRMMSRMAPWWSGTEVQEEQLRRRRGAGRTAVGEKKKMPFWQKPKITPEQRKFVDIFPPLLLRRPGRHLQPALLQDLHHPHLDAEDG